MTNNSMEPREEVKELADCPFCGSEAVMKEPHGEYLVQCSRIGDCMGKHDMTNEGYSYRKDAVERWNTRSSKPVETNGLSIDTQWLSSLIHKNQQGCCAVDVVAIKTSLEEKFGTTQSAKVLDWNCIQRVLRNVGVEEKVDEYELRADNGDYSPNEQEKTLMQYFAYGLLGEIEEEFKRQIGYFSTTKTSIICENCGWNNNECKCIKG